MIQRCLPLLALSLAATAADAAPTGPTLYEAAFTKHYVSREFGAVGPYYPIAAAHEGITGDVTIQCRIVPPAPGRLTNCAVVGETPRGLLFGVSALKMAADGAITITPDIGPPPAPGATVRVHVPFTIGR
jgi:hypothetical protein